MDAVLLIAGLFVLWIWLHGHPIGALVAFLALFFTGLPAILIPSLATLPKLEGVLAYLGIAAAVALAPMMIRSIYRDFHKKRHLAQQAEIHERMQQGMRSLVIGAGGFEEAVANSWRDADLKLWARSPAGLERGELLLTGKVASRHAGASDPDSARPRIEPTFEKPVS